MCQHSGIKLQQQTHHNSQGRIHQTPGTNHRRYWQTKESTPLRKSGYPYHKQHYYQKNVRTCGTRCIWAPCHKLKPSIEAKLETLLKEYASQFAQDKTSIGMTPVTKMTIDTGTWEPVLQNPYLITMTHSQWVKDEIEKLLTAKVIQGSQSSWSAPIIVVPKGDGGKHLVIDHWALNKATRKLIWPMPKVEAIFFQLNGATYFSTLDLWAGYHHIHLDEASIPKTTFSSSFGKYKYIKVSFGLAQAPAYIQELMTGTLKDFNFAFAYLDDIVFFSKTAEEHLDRIKQVFENWEAHTCPWNSVNVTFLWRKSSI